MMYASLAAFLAVGIPFRFLARRVLRLNETVPQALASEINTSTALWAALMIVLAASGGAS